jgi:starch-binding outer membrane protein, SusD/RagB family
MKKKSIILILILGLIISGSCKKNFLDVKPAGALDASLLTNQNGLDALLVGAYSMLPGTKTFNWTWEAASSNWVYGSIRGLEANKGTDSGDQPDINPIQTYTETATNPYLNLRWRSIYEGVSRTNNLINLVNVALKNATITQDQATLYIQQARALRGWYHFEAWRMWGGKVPYLDETTDPATASNDADISGNIIADLQEGVKLPLNMGAVGKFNKTVVEVILGKAMMQMNHDYAGALTVLLDAKNTGTKPNGNAIGLAPTYGEIFDIANRNGIESIYTVQYSVNDGSGAKNAGDGEVLNFPYKGNGSPGGCCGFFDPTQEFVNSFITSAAGLPLLDHSYNTLPVKNDFGIAANPVKSKGLLAYVDNTFVPDAGTLDPRLDWSVGRRGIAYWDWGLHTGADWIRDQTYSGPYSPKKQVYKKSQEGTWTEVGNWTSGWTANGYRMIRYADLLLLIAECQIETNDLAGALVNINLVRARAANPAGFVKKIDPVTGADTNVPAANYVIAQYATLGTQANAREALRMERKLELGQEGHRWFDLNRWGITTTELNRALAYEETMQWGSSLYGGATAKATSNLFPIPQRQLDLSNGKLVQNQ